MFRRATSLFAATVALLAGPAAAETLTGRAMIDTRMALPADVTFEAVIADISRADAPAEVLARTVIENPGQPPIDFAIDYDPAELRPRAIYALRATIRRSDRLLYTTDTITRVLDGAVTGPVDLQLRVVNSLPRADAGPVGAHGLRLPASFTGVLPCADCEGIRHHLDLWPDQVYHLRREWLGRAEGPMRRDEVGRWYADPVRGAIVLYGASEMPLVWEVKGPDRLRQTDLAGNPIVSDLPYELTSDGTLDPTEIEGTFLLGMMTYFADAAMFAECLTGRAYPIATEGDYLALERAYLEAGADPGAPLLVHVEGGLAMRQAMEGGDRMHLVVERFNRIVPGETCPAQVSTASLTNTYWRIDSLMGAAVAATENRREPHLVLMDEPETRFRATVGCNQFIGGYTQEDGRLTFGPVASTRMACPPPLDAIERQLGEVLSATGQFRLEGDRLDLIDDTGAVLAELRAVYLR
jgi:copper homeostasis protein (lipoprotein)